MAGDPGRPTGTPTTTLPTTGNVSVGPRIGLALSDGGARGDFEVGVVRYLYSVQKVRPSVISGTSVGSIAALKLAEGEPSAASPAPPGYQQAWRGFGVP